MNIPEDWKTFKLGVVVESTQLGGNYQNTKVATRFPLIKMGNLGRGKIALSKLEFVPESDPPAQKDRLERGNVLLNTRNTLELVGKVSIWRGELEEAYFNSNILRFKFKRDAFDNYYANLLFNSGHVLARLRSFAIGTTSVAAIYWRDLRNLKLTLPPLPEQKKIAEILGACDEAIEAEERLITQKQQRKKGLMQKLLTGDVRFPEFEGTADWTYIPLGKVSTRLKDKAGTKDLDVLSITAGRGYVAQKDKFSKVIAGRNYANYVVLENGDFSYNKGNSLRFPQGCIYRLDEYDRGAVPNVFYSFRMDPERTVSGFFVQLFKMGYQNKQLRAYINSGVRNDGLLNLHSKDFFKMTVPVPSVKEQQVLSDFFENLDTEIALFQKQLEQLKQQKKGLMQQLLTGKVRVKV
jgi:type I restriction enzyme S subunit